MSILSRENPLGAQSGSHPAKRPVLWAILLLLTVMAAAKLLVLVMPPEAISPFGLPDNEEWRRGMAASEWIRGPLLPYIDYQQGHFQGGTLLTVLLVALSYLGFGESPFTMRLANLVYDGTTVAFLFLFVDRLISRRAAWTAGILAAIPSPGYLMVGSIVWASHVEANAFALLLLWAWHRVVFRERRALAEHSPAAGAPMAWASSRGEFVLGVLAGISIWFHYGLLMWLAVMLLVEFAARPSFLLRRGIYVRVVGVLVGLLPFWNYNLHNDWKGLGVYGKSASGHFQASATSIQETFERLITHFLPHSMYLPEWGGAGRVIEWTFLVAATAAWVAMSFLELRAWRRTRRPSPLLAVAIYPVLWVVLYTFGTFHGQDRWVSGYRYMLPLHPIGWIALAIMLARMRKSFELVVVATAAAVFLAGIISFLEPKAIRPNWSAPGSNPASIARLLFMRHSDHPEIIAGAIERSMEERSPIETELLAYTLGNSFLFKANDTSVPRRALASYEPELAIQRANYRKNMAILAERMPAPYKPYFTRLPGTSQTAWSWARRDDFWKQWKRLGFQRPAGGYRE